LEFIRIIRTRKR